MLCSVYNARGILVFYLGYLPLRLGLLLYIHLSVASMQPLIWTVRTLPYLVVRGSSHTTRTFSGAVLLSLSQDNVISCSVFHIMKRCEHLFVPLQIDTFPCEPKEDDILAALMQLLPWVCIIIHVCGCVCVIILFLLSLII